MQLEDSLIDKLNDYFVICKYDKDQKRDKKFGTSSKRMFTFRAIIDLFADVFCNMRAYELVVFRVKLRINFVWI